MFSHRLWRNLTNLLRNLNLYLKQQLIENQMIQMVFLKCYLDNYADGSWLCGDGLVFSVDSSRVCFYF